MSLAWLKFVYIPLKIQHFNLITLNRCMKDVIKRRRKITVIQSLFFSSVRVNKSRSFEIWSQCSSWKHRLCSKRYCTRSSGKSINRRSEDIGRGRFFARTCHLPLPLFSWSFRRALHLKMMSDQRQITVHFINRCL